MRRAGQAGCVLALAVLLAAVAAQTDTTQLSDLSCSALKCSHECAPSANGGTCVCKEGLVLAADNSTCTCPKGLVLSGDNSRCVCPQNQILSADNITCTWPRFTIPYNDDSKCTCPKGKMLSSGSCTCTLPKRKGLFAFNRTRTCPQGLILSADNSTCTCPKGFIFSAGKNICTCPEGFTFSADKSRCICKKGLILSADNSTCTCPEGFILSADRSICTCPEGFIFSADKSRCICKEGLILSADNSTCTCPEGFILSADKSICTCPDGFIFSADKSTCICKEGLTLSADKSTCTCPEGLIMSADESICICKDGLILSADKRTCTCPEGLILSADKSTCTCPKGFILSADKSICTCPENFIFSADKSTCICKDGLILSADKSTCTCPEGLILSADKSICTCPEGFIFSADKNTCICKEGLILSADKSTCTCPEGFILSADKSICTCPDGFIFSADKSTCICKEGLTLSADKSTCTCPEGLIMSADESICICKDGLILSADKSTCTCPEGLILSADKSTCTCPKGFILSADKSICTCPENFIFSADKSTCICKDGLILSADKSTCTCPKGLILSADKSICTCPENFIFSADKNTCICKEGLMLSADKSTCTCPEGFILSAGTSTCTCPEGKMLSSQNNSCIDDQCRKWGSCDQLCVNIRRSYRCACAPGYSLVANGRCSARSADALLVLAHELGALTLDLLGGTPVTLINNSAAGLDYHYRLNLLFWTDVKTGKIHSRPLNPSAGQSSDSGKDIFFGESWEPVALAVDWVADKLYVVDAMGLKIDLIELNGQGHALVLSSNLTNPTDIALDPTLGLMFVADSDRIIRANMDGSELRTIFFEATYVISGIAVDTIAQRIFLCDSNLGVIETVDYDGHYRFKVLEDQELFGPSRLTLFEDRVYWSDGKKRGISSVNKYEGASSVRAMNGTQDLREPKALTVVHSLKQTSVNNPCGNNNGGCSHMCIVTALSGGGLGYRCVCNMGYKLKKDSKSCELVKEFLVYSHQTVIKTKILDATTEGFTDVIPPVVSKRDRYVSLDFDARDEHIYFSDVLHNIIYRIHRNGTKKEIVLPSENLSVEGLAVDWVSKNLYYTDSGRKSLNVLSMRNIKYIRALLKDLNRPRSIVVYPKKGFIFFSEWDQPAKISRANSDGSGLMVFENVELGWPNGLAIDFDTDRVYWCDALLDSVQHTKLDGTDVKIVNSRLLKHPYSIVIYKDFMYISDWTLKALFRMHKLTGEQENILVTSSETSKVFGVKIYSEEVQRIESTHPCAKNNGNCEKFCFAIPTNNTVLLTVKCGCPYGEKLAPDEISCISNTIAEPPVQACPNEGDYTCNNKRCIPRSWVCDGSDDCLDNSDETEICKKTCSPTTFTCPSGRCIPNSFICDFNDDCGDNSDELNCERPTCTESQYQCGSGRCIHETRKCDGQDDCGDGTDEGPHCANETMPSLSNHSCVMLACEYMCVESASGDICTCPEGQVLSDDNRSCQCAEGHELSADNRTCLDRNECREWGICHQLCINTPGSYTCACAPGYALGAGGRCAARAAGAWLALAHERGALRYDLHTRSSASLTNSPGVAGLDYHYRRNLLFWSDVKRRKIYSRSLNASVGISSHDADDITVAGSWDPVALAVDWVGDKLYVVDSLGQKIDVFELDGRWHTVVSSDLTDPSDIALDPTLGLMFIADSNHIIRANMDGTQPTSLFYKGTLKAAGIAVDTIARRIFWSDSLLGSIETVDYDGNHQVLVLRDGQVPSPSRLTLFEDRVYWSDNKKQGVYNVSKFESVLSNKALNKTFGVNGPKALTVVHSLKQTFVENPCGSNNGGCSQMCLVTALLNGGLGFRCACSVGYKLKTNQKDCALVKEFIFYSGMTFVKGKYLDPVIETSNEAIMPFVSKKARIGSVDFDAIEEYIYFADFLQNVIYRVNRNGTTRELILIEQNEFVESIAVDWVSKYLYYINSRNGTLNVISTRNILYKKTLLKGLKRPRAIVVDPNKGFIFFSEWDRPANISRVNTDGSGLLVFKDLTLGLPNGLAIDFDADRIYWCDAQLDHVQHANFDGTDVKTVNSKLIKHPFSIFVHKDLMYLSDWNSNAIYYMHKLTGEQEKIVVKTTGSNRFFGLKVYSEEVQRIDATHPCVINNGYCEKFCFAVPNDDPELLTAKCDCPDGEILAEDGTSCINGPKMKSFVETYSNTRYFVCKNQRCIPKTWVCDGEDDCLDNSDEEQYCTRANCSSRQFACKTGRCIPAKFKCDYKKDCGDGDDSDEEGCVRVTCNPMHFQCANGACIPRTWACDSEYDCSDGSDEGSHCFRKANKQFHVK